MKCGEVDEMLEDFSNGTYDFTENGNCIQCGACCSNILPMTDKEIAVIRNYIKNNGIKERKHLIPTATPTIDMTCPFLNSDKPKEKCEIYPVRPRICKDFICCPEKRHHIGSELKDNFRIVNVRKEFYSSGVED